MISIKQKVAELEQCIELRKKALSCLRAAISTAAQYVVEVDEQISAAHREHLNRLADSIGQVDTEEPLERVRSAFRLELRDYRDKAATILNSLRLELRTNADTLAQILTSMSADADDHEVRLRLQVKKLRAVARLPEAQPVRQSLETATSSLEECVEQIKKQNQLTVAQFLVEIQMLHQRIESLQSAASMDELSRMCNRREMEAKIRSAASAGAPFCLVVLKIQNLRSLERQYSPSIVTELIAAFSKRLHNQMKPETVLGRWSTSEFSAILTGEKSEIIAFTKQLTQCLSGTYVCMENGEARRLQAQISAGVVDSPRGEDVRRVIARAEEVLAAA